jgi:hypothetical protein
VLVYKRDVDVAVRASWADVNRDVMHDQAWGLEVSSTWYIHAPEIALKVRYGHGHQANPGTPTAAGALLVATPGSVDGVTVQLNVAF